MTNKSRYIIKWGYLPDNLNMIFISGLVDESQKAIDEFYEMHPDMFCSNPKKYTI